MLVHLRLTVPAALADAVRRLVVEHDHTTNVTLQAGAGLKPPGDLIEVDVARESAAALVRDLQALGLDEDGGIVLTTPTGTPFRAARVLEAQAPGHPDDAVIWDSVEATAYGGATPTLSYHVFLVIAVALAAVAVITDSSVLVVGAMVVGPEFSAIAALCVGLVLRRPRLITRSAMLLVLGFALAIGVVTVLALLARATGMVEAVDITRPRPGTGFIWHPDRWSFVVAVLAGAAGALALAIERSTIMVGVFISVTTVPAAGNLALGLAVGDAGEIGGSAAQLGLNVVGMVTAGVLVLLLIRTAWPWLALRAERIFGTAGPA
ncbi:DUF389 domain-containing protein [Nocardioides rubriscoriae]|uniref:DUF389 domain-containing protein n=1 Tax=Nocardioides rubriscoriae TaxID=642762 RepID=UPI0011E02BFF|nr:DUF389 domain-containing protein [Nocardioides rubriscoriae]